MYDMRDADRWEMLAARKAARQRDTNRTRRNESRTNRLLKKHGMKALPPMPMGPGKPDNRERMEHASKLVGARRFISNHNTSTSTLKRGQRRSGRTGR